MEAGSLFKHSCVDRIKISVIPSFTAPSKTLKCITQIITQKNHHKENDDCNPVTVFHVVIYFVIIQCRLIL